MKTDTKTELRLVGEDGNAFAILGRARKAAKRDNWSVEEIDAMTAAVTSAGSYDEFLQVIMKYFEVE